MNRSSAYTKFFVCVRMGVHVCMFCPREQNINLLCLAEFPGNHKDKLLQMCYIEIPGERRRILVLGQYFMRIIEQSKIIHLLRLAQLLSNQILQTCPIDTTGEDLLKAAMHKVQFLK